MKSCAYINGEVVKIIIGHIAWNTEQYIPWCSFQSLFRCINASYDNAFIAQVPLSKRNGTSRSDFGSMWWDYIVLNGTETSFVLIDILSVYDGSRYIGIMEAEFYIGQGIEDPS